MLRVATAQPVPACRRAASHHGIKDRASAQGAAQDTDPAPEAVARGSRVAKLALAVPPAPEPWRQIGDVVRDIVDPIVAKMGVEDRDALAAELEEAFAANQAAWSKPLADDTPEHKAASAASDRLVGLLDRVKLMPATSLADIALKARGVEMEVMTETRPGEIVLDPMHPNRLEGAAYGLAADVLAARDAGLFRAVPAMAPVPVAPDPEDVSFPWPLDVSEDVFADMLYREIAATCDERCVPIVDLPSYTSTPETRDIVEEVLRRHVTFTSPSFAAAVRHGLWRYGDRCLNGTTRDEAIRWEIVTDAANVAEAVALSMPATNAAEARERVAYMIAEMERLHELNEEFTVDALRAVYGDIHRFGSPPVDRAAA